MAKGIQGGGVYRLYANLETWTISSTGDRGQPVGSWVTTYTNVPCGIEELSGRQLELARQLVASATHRVSLRWISGVVPMTTRINFGGRLLKIEHVNEFDFRKLYLQLLCTEQKTGAA
jgi:SPP1 family predicted phage head-tail adaptor